MSSEELKIKYLNLSARQLLQVGEPQGLTASFIRVYRRLIILRFFCHYSNESQMLGEVMRSHL
ncbi:MAG: hypothetical protein RMX68_016130 [Aulosira sp. ZfuVER01]|nr:hypothetical protein [Aulosira sp. ZfuVER01]MDZ8001967.1 hypothetical protein [Aulosira sp. DedVER01a]MDZ8054955.1 hypothetical protein [Aulosira sp. ZfuCHP01]